MKKFVMLSAVMLCAVAVLLTGCTNDPNAPTSPNAAGVNVTGTWALSAGGQTQTVTLQQNGDALTGSVQGIPATGSITGNNISFTTGVPGGPTLVVEGTVDGSATSMSGNYTATEATGTQHTGTWTATKQ